MKRLILLALLMLTLLLAGCTGPETAPEEGLPGYPSCAIDLTTDGQRVLLLRRGKTYPEWSRTFTVFDVTGGGMRRIVSGRDAVDFALLDGRLWVASRTLDWLKAMQVSAELDAYDPVRGASAVHVSARQDEGSEGRINPDFYGFHIAGERLIRQRNFAVDLTYRQEFAFADNEGYVGEPFWQLPYTGVTVTDTFLAGAEYGGDVIDLFDLKRMEAHRLPVLWGQDQFDDPYLPQGVLLAGVLYYPAADGVRAYDLAAGQDDLFAASSATEYFYVTDGRLYTVADDGLLTAFDLRTGVACPTEVKLAKTDRYIVVGENAYILQTPEQHGVRETGCRVEALMTGE
ncbi:MAG: hypothetical protein IJ343_02910 [Clostridia bacterium]|nr:hypothetical protein [Clostridia bacterium]